MIKGLLFFLFFLIASSSCWAQQFISASVKTADSLFFSGKWNEALKEYNKSLSQSSELTNNAVLWNRVGFCYHNIGNYKKALESYQNSEKKNPSVPLQQVLYPRFSKTYFSIGDKNNAYMYLNKAIDVGFSGVMDLDTSREYVTVRNEKDFMELREKAMDNAYPCRKDPHSREFDFWVGDWDAYVTGTNMLVGHSIIQKASGACMILENWTSLRSQYEGKSMNFINTETGKWERVWVGSEGRANNNVHRFFNGEYKDNVMKFDFETTDTSGKKLIGRFSFFNQGPDQVRQLQETSGDLGKTWSTNYDFTYKRKK